jgi:hypothetical protein
MSPRQSPRRASAEGQSDRPAPRAFRGRAAVFDRCRAAHARIARLAGAVVDPRCRTQDRANLAADRAQNSAACTWSCSPQTLTDLSGWRAHARRSGPKGTSEWESTRDRTTTLHKNLPICRQLYIIVIIERSYEATLSAMGILGDPEPGRRWGPWDRGPPSCFLGLGAKRSGSDRLPTQLPPGRLCGLKYAGY